MRHERTDEDRAIAPENQRVEPQRAHSCATWSASTAAERAHVFLRATSVRRRGQLRGCEIRMPIVWKEAMARTLMGRDDGSRRRRHTRSTVHWPRWRTSFTVGSGRTRIPNNRAHASLTVDADPRSATTPQSRVGSPAVRRRSRLLANARLGERCEQFCSSLLEAPRTGFWFWNVSAVEAMTSSRSPRSVRLPDSAGVQVPKNSRTPLDRSGLRHGELRQIRPTKRCSTQGRGRGCGQNAG